MDRETGGERLIEAERAAVGAGPGGERGVRRGRCDPVRTESLIDPPSWHDVDLATGRWQLRKRQEVPGYDPAGYVTERLTAAAARRHRRSR